MELSSRTWSAETLQLGVSLVTEGVGMDKLDDKSDQQLQDELRMLEDCVISCLFPVKSGKILDI